MIDINLLAFALSQAYPGSTRENYFLSYHVGIDGKQDADSSIMSWTLDAPQPTPDELPALCEKYRAQFEEDGLKKDAQAIIESMLMQFNHEIEEAQNKGDEARVQLLQDIRQKVLDVPNQPGYPKDIEWPDVPLAPPQTAYEFIPVTASPPPDPPILPPQE
ncbi:hypothetical protein AB4Y45_25335 [Paraburkholderia sp. EG287A]|uniref:XkdW family protein n=1 Tax=unclassified Paraburkholderia TaxID=2615204 RepID=UPI0034D37EA7